jgi:DNA helicase-2/ATP-dependent DNA helicase PcrA
MIEEILQQNLTNVQYAAVADNADEILCLACAGSGKSRTLAYRIVRLIAEGNSPESIVAFTFTEKAAESIKRRVSEALDKCGLDVALVGAMYIGTIHSYCQNLLGEMNAKYRQYEVLDENRLKIFLLSRYWHLGMREVQAAKNARMFQTISEISNAWKTLNDELITLDAIETEDAVLGQCLKTINERLNDDQYIDFSLMIRLVVDALRENRQEINRALQNVKHLMVDEYQDVNPSQEALIQGIYERIDSLFVVGDDDQSIYGWRGADVRNIIEFDQRYPHCSTHNLTTNFRSTDAIVQTSNTFIQVELSSQRIDKTPVSNSEGNIRHFGNLWFGTKEDEASWVAQRINQLIGTKYIDGDGTERGLTKSDFAILMRSVLGGTNWGAAPHHREYTNALNVAGIAYTIEAEGSIFERPHARVLREAMGLLRTSGVPRSSVKDYFESYVIPHFQNANFNEFANVIADWNSQIHRPAGGARRKVYPQKLVHDLLHAFGVQRTNLDDAVMRDIGVFSSIILDVEKVFISIDSTQRFQSVLNFLENIAESGYDTSEVELVARPDAVTVSTVHKMKGLEFPVVFIVDVVNLRFPKSRSNYSGWLPSGVMQNAISRGLYQTDRYGEARLFYTALTRAERFLYVTGSAVQAGLAKPKRPSDFKLRLTNEAIVTDAAHLPPLETAIQRRRIDDNSMPTSFTEIKDYLECPMKYKYRKVFGFSPAVPELFGFGLTTHTSINKLHQNFPNSVPSTQNAQDAVEDVFHLKHVFPSNDPNRPGPFERAKERTKELVSKYVEDYSYDFIQNRQVERKFEIKADRALITGAIDLLLKEDNQGRILDAKVIDFKSMDFPETPDNFYWINLALQVQLYAHASRIVLGEDTKTGAVHLLKGENVEGLPNRVEVPVTDAAIDAAIQNIIWAVNQILSNDFPRRPSHTKCEGCDFNLICSKARENFNCTSTPPEIQIPNIHGVRSIMVRAFSDVG